MPRLIILAVTLLSAFSVLAGPKATWLSDSHDFGAFDEDLSTVTCQFRAVNTGDEPLVILSARANCGCTTPRFSKEPVAPGDTAVITVGYNAVGRPGKFAKKVMVTTNASSGAKTTLYISGTVIGTSNTLRGRYPVDRGSMKLRSDMIAFGTVEKPAVATDYIEAYNASRDTIRPRVVRRPQFVDINIMPPAVPPGETFVIAGLFATPKCDRWDVVADTLSLAAGTDTVDIALTAIVREHFTPGAKAPQIRLDPATLDLGRVGHAGRLQRRLTVSNAGNAPLIIRQVSCVDPAVTVSVRRDAVVKPGKTLKIPVDIDLARAANSAMLNAMIVIIANDPVVPRSVVRVVGELTE